MKNRAENKTFISQKNISFKFYFKVLIIKFSATELFTQDSKLCKKNFFGAFLHLHLIISNYYFTINYNI